MYITIMEILLAILFIPVNAYAYIDPGVGGFFVQILLGIMAGLIYIARVFWISIKTFFIKLSSKVFHPSKSPH